MQVLACRFSKKKKEGQQGNKLLWRDATPHTQVRF